MAKGETSIRDGMTELEQDLVLARLGDHPGAAGCKRIAAAYDDLEERYIQVVASRWRDPTDEELARAKQRRPA